MLFNLETLIQCFEKNNDKSKSFAAFKEETSKKIAILKSTTVSVEQLAGLFLLGRNVQFRKYMEPAFVEFFSPFEKFPKEDANGMALLLDLSMEFNMANLSEVLADRNVGIDVIQAAIELAELGLSPYRTP